MIDASQAHTPARELFTAWCQWCHGNGEEAGTEKAFAESMGGRGLEKKKAARGMVYRGLMLYREEGETL